MFNKEIEDMKKKQMEILELKNTITKKRNNTLLEMTEEIIKEFEDKSIKIIQAEQQTG